MSDAEMVQSVPVVALAEAGADHVVPGTEPIVAHEAGAVEIQVATKPEIELLRMQQQYALEELMAGKSYADAARTAGVDRRTLFRWVNHDPAFRAAMENWRRQIVRMADDRLAQSAEDAATTLGAAARTDFRAAALLLKGRGLLAGSSRSSRPSQANPLLEMIEPGRWGEFEIRLQELVLSFQKRSESQE